MDRHARIAVVGPVDERLLGDLRRLPLQPEVRACTSLVTDSEALARFQPDLLVIALPAEPAEEIGALRLLRQLWPALGAMLVVSPEQELAMAALAQRSGARLLVHPCSPGSLAGAVEQALGGGDRPHADAFLDLVRGLADEINNPLQFVAGHLQLLRASFANAPERERRDAVHAALRGIERVHGSLERLRLLTEAGNGPRQSTAVDLTHAMRSALAERRPDETPQAVIAVPVGPHTVSGDVEHLTEAVRALRAFADDLARAGAEVQLDLTALPDAQRLRLVARGGLLANWRLPRTFEPYYPSRALRGQSLGLGLFLAQTVVLGHRGQAQARRLADGALQLDFVLPA
jgi:signal transduction histidine kinase